MVPVEPATALPTKFTGTVMSAAPPASCTFMVMLRPLLLAICAWMRGRSDWGKDSEIFTGWISLIVTSGLAVVMLPLAPVLAVTMLPGWIRIAPVLPFTGERIWVYSRFRRAASAVAWASR